MSAMNIVEFVIGFLTKHPDGEMYFYFEDPTGDVQTYNEIIVNRFSPVASLGPDFLRFDNTDDAPRMPRVFNVNRLNNIETWYDEDKEQFLEQPAVQPAMGGN
jgi:hypothetical protein